MYIGKSISKLGREHDSAGGQATNVHNICYLANSQKEGGPPASNEGPSSLLAAVDDGTNLPFRKKKSCWLL